MILALEMPLGLSDHVSVGGFLVILAAVTFGSLVQGTLGFGAAVVAVPFVALVQPDALPVTMQVAAVPMVLAMAARERAGTDWRGVGWMSVGRFPGVVAGTWLVTVVSGSSIALLAGVGVLAATAVSATDRVQIRLTRLTQTATGFLSGLMGTATAIGGPPLVLLYQRERPVVVRATLAVSFATGLAMALATLTLAGVVKDWHLALAGLIFPGSLLGLALSTPVTRLVDDRWFRPAVLVFVTVTACIAVFSAL